MLVGTLMVFAVVAGILTARADGEEAPKTRVERARTIRYWTLTIAVAFEMVAGGTWDLLRIEFVRVSLARLEYPLYLLYILGPPKILCAIAGLVPRLPRLKERAYSGAVINLPGSGGFTAVDGKADCGVGGAPGVRCVDDGTVGAATCDLQNGASQATRDVHRHDAAGDMCHSAERCDLSRGAFRCSSLQRRWRLRL
jgi:hypothetical protein